MLVLLLSAPLVGGVPPQPNCDGRGDASVMLVRSREAATEQHANGPCVAATEDGFATTLAGVDSELKSHSDSDGFTSWRSVSASKGNPTSHCIAAQHAQEMVTHATLEELCQPAGDVQFGVRNNYEHATARPACVSHRGECASLPWLLYKFELASHGQSVVCNNLSLARHACVSRSGCASLPWGDTNLS